MTPDPKAESQAGFNAWWQEKLDSRLWSLRAIEAYRSWCEAAYLAGRAGRDEAVRERDEARAGIRSMIEKAADQKLDGYRALGARAAAAENERDAIQLQLTEARAALQGKTVSCVCGAEEKLRGLVARLEAMTSAWESEGHYRAGACAAELTAAIARATKDGG